MAIASRFYIPNADLQTGQHYYVTIRNSSVVSEPLRTSIGGGVARGIYNTSSGQFVDIQTVSCSTGSDWADYVLSTEEENAGSCGGLYSGVLPTRLQQPGLQLELFVWKQTGQNPNYSADELISVITHNTGRVEHTAETEIVPDPNDANLVRITLITKQDGRLKDPDSMSISVNNPGYITAGPYRVSEGIHYSIANVSSLTNYIEGTTEAIMDAGPFAGSSWVSNGTPSTHLGDISILSRNNLDAQIQDIKNRPEITGA